VFPWAGLQVRGAQDKVNEAQAKIDATSKSIAETAKSNRAVQAGGALSPVRQAVPPVSAI